MGKLRPQLRKLVILWDYLCHTMTGERVGAFLLMPHNDWRTG